MNEQGKQEPVAWSDDYEDCKCPDNPNRCFSDRVFRMMQKHAKPAPAVAQEAVAFMLNRSDGSKYYIDHYDPRPISAEHGLPEPVALYTRPALAVDLNEKLYQAAVKLAHDLRDLISESQGVAGLHRNGELAEWVSLTRGGKFESWLMSLNELEEALIGAGNHTEATLEKVPAVAANTQMREALREIANTVEEPLWYQEIAEKALESQIDEVGSAFTQEPVLTQRRKVRDNCEQCGGFGCNFCMELEPAAVAPAVAVNEQMLEALKLADAALEGAHMDADVVYRKVKAAIVAAQAAKGGV